MSNWDKFTYVKRNRDKDDESEQQEKQRQREEQIALQTATDVAIYSMITSSM